MANSMHARIAEQVSTDYILSGVVKTGERLPSVRSLQAQYGVGHSIIWHALGILEMEGYIEKRHGSGCFVIPRTRDFTKVMTDTIGFIGASNLDGLPLLTQQGVESVCEKTGYQVLFASNNDNYEQEYKKVCTMVESGCAGIVVQPGGRLGYDTAKDYLTTEFRDIPIVTVDGGKPEHGRPMVEFDNYTAAHSITEYLISLGHKRIAFLGTPENHYSTSIHARRRGYLDAMREASLEVRPEDDIVVPVYLNADEMYEFHRSVMEKWSRSRERATVFIGLHDISAMLLIRIAQKMGVRVPEDITVTGFDGYSISRNFSPAFITTRPNFYYAGIVAARMLIDLLAHPRREERPTYILPVPIKRPSAERGEQLEDEYTLTEHSPAYKMLYGANPYIDIIPEG